MRYLDGLLINISNRCRIVLEKIVHAEAQGEGLEGQIHVGNVIINRCRSSAFPDGIYNVVFAHSVKDDGSKVYRFSPVGDGAYEKAVPSASVKAAVDKVLEGRSDSQGATYFCSVASAQKGNWHERALTFLFEHGNHRFYR